MIVKLTGITTGYGEYEGKTAEEMIVGMARVSSGRSQDELFDQPHKLINYLIKHSHWSPFEMVSMSVYIETSRAIAQQILRHRSFSFQEFSQRYASATCIEPFDIRMKAEKNRQSSLDVIDDESLSDQINDLIFRSQRLYQDLLDNDVARETARFVLPLATQTSMYMQGTIRSWIHYLMIRDEGHVQLEHQLIAQEIKKIFIKQFPNISKALEWTH